MIQKVDFATIAQDVYALAASDEPLARPVKEALDVIDEALETWGYACSITLQFALVPT